MNTLVESTYKTPANVPNNRQELRPLPLRVANSQYDRLCSARDRTGISIQEHCRRALDVYLGQIEREALDLGLMSRDRTPTQQKGRKR